VHFFLGTLMYSKKIYSSIGLVIHGIGRRQSAWIMQNKKYYDCCLGILISIYISVWVSVVP
jgi:hypothetical protein